MTDTDTNEELLKKVFKDEENDNIVLSIREELMDRVMDECYKSYLKKQTVRFTVQCAYDALVKFLSFDFYYHPDVPDTRQSTWIPDEPIKPSPKDTWASDAVPIRPTDFKVDEEEAFSYDLGHTLADGKTVSIRDLTTDSEGCMCLEHVCTCLLSPEEYSKKLDLMYAKPCPSEIKLGPKSSKDSLCEKKSLRDSSGHLSLKDGGLSSRTSVRSRSGSQTRTNATSTTDPYVSSTGVESGKSRLSKRKSKTQTKEVKLEVPDKLLNGSTASIVALSPIRVNSTFNSKPEGKQKKGK